MEEEDEIQAQACKFPRVLENGIRNGEEDRGSTNRLHRWHHSSRIIRVSRASGGKDRHSKVMTSKGLRDRRVRLSVTTAIQFYDLQDRLGYDQPSKAVEWLIKSAADSIAELPSLNNTFPDTPKSDGENNNNNNNKCLSKSGCSSTSETSKGSGLSLSRSDIRVKARERARERTAKEKEKENTNELHHQQQQQHHHHNVNPISQTASFTELLTGGISNAVPTTITTPRGCDEVNMFNKAPMDYFLGPSSSRTTYHHHQSCSSGFSLSQIQLPETMNSVSAFNNSSSDPHQLQQHFSFIPDHLMSAVVTSSSAAAAAQASGNEYNLNFSISSGLAGYNRGTLQSNSHPSMLPHLQRFSPVDGSTTVPFFVGAAPATATAVENNNNNNNNHHHHQFSSVFDGSRFQLYYADGCRHSDHNKGKPKN